MRGWLMVLAATSAAATGIAGAQDSAAAKAAPTARVHGRLAAVTSGGSPLRAGDAYLWADTPALRALLSAACTAARTNATLWTDARTELAMPTGAMLDSAAAPDLQTLHALATEPHASAAVDSTGRFAFDSIPAGDYWIEAESMDGATIAQWWRHVSYAPADLAVARLMAGRAQNDPLSVDLDTGDRVQNEFCADSSARASGLVAIGNGASYRIMPGGPNAGTDSPPMPIGPPPLPEFPASLFDRHVETTVEVSFMVRADGTVDPNTIAVSGGVNSDVVNAIRAAVRKWRFEPARRDGKAIAKQQKIEFGLGIGPG